MCKVAQVKRARDRVSRKKEDKFVSKKKRNVMNESGLERKSASSLVRSK